MCIRDRGEVVSTIAIATSSIVTTVIIALGAVSYTHLLSKSIAILSFVPTPSVPLTSIIASIILNGIATFEWRG